MLAAAVGPQTGKEGIVMFGLTCVSSIVSLSLVFDVEGTSKKEKKEVALIPL